jgi:hypothetical protein
VAKHKALKIHKSKEKDISKGVYLTEGAYPAFGAGWYHINTTRKIRSSRVIPANGT